MDMSKVGSNILKAFGILGVIAGAIRAIYLILFVVTIVLGSVFKVAADGSLPITDGANTTLTTLETSYNTVIGSVNTSTEFAGSLIPIAIILIVFGGVVVLVYMGYKSYKDKKGGDMGY